MDIVGKSDATNYFNIYCAECEVQTKNEYWPGKDLVPHFKATCPQCGGSEWYKLSQADWKNLPI